MKRTGIALVIAVSVVVCSCKKEPPPPPSTPTPVTTTAPASGVPVYGYQVVRSYPHDPLAFTEGLFILDGKMYEGTGLNDSSDIRQVDLASGNVLRSRKIDAQYFGEGISIVGGRLFELTWRNNTCFVYDEMGFKPIDTMVYGGEGWGLTTDGKELIMSDGSNSIRFIDPATFQTKRTIVVFDGNAPLNQLNELEYVKGEVYANVWKTDSIVRIDPKDGTILGWINLKGLLPESERTGNEDVLNGIAYDAKGDRLFVTGKRWAKLYEIKLTGGPAAPVADTTKPSLK